MISNSVTMSLLGTYGRFGNQLFQYAAIRIYARRYGLQWRTAPWVGEKLFGLPSCPIDTILPRYIEPCGAVEQPCVDPPDGRVLCGRDYRGYAQYHTSYFSPHRKWLRELYCPDGAVMARLTPPLKRLHARGNTIVGLHLRRGDYGRQQFYITPVAWYLEWLRTHWQDLDDPVLFIATETPALVAEFAEYSPLTTTDMGIDLQSQPLADYTYLDRDLELKKSWQMDFFPDWFFLSQCHVLLMPNSTFSFTAAMFSDNLCHLYRSDLPSQEFAEIDPWNGVPITYDQAEDYKRIPGVCLEDNPYW